MSRVLIVPDIHNAVERAEAIISAHGAKCDRVVLLGDFFDDFNDGPADTARVAKWLVQSIKDPRRQHLVGNHDLGYLGSEMAAVTYRCPGWDIAKYEAVTPILQDLDRTQIYAAVACEGWLMSHAGFQRAHLEGRTMEQLLVACREAFDRALDGLFDPLFAPSRARGFGNHIGGLTWLDWSNEFHPIDGWHQIVGHTPSRRVRAAFASATSIGHWDLLQQPVPEELCDRERFTSVNWCMDTKLGAVGVIDNGRFEIIWL